MVGFLLEFMVVSFVEWNEFRFTEHAEKAQSFTETY